MLMMLKRIDDELGSGLGIEVEYRVSVRLCEEDVSS